MIAGAFTCDTRDESVYLIVSSAIGLVVMVRHLLTIWKKQEIVVFLHRAAEHSIEDQEQFNLMNGKLEKFMKFAVVLFWTTTVLTLGTTLVAPLVGDEKKMILNVAFPFDWRTIGVVFWIEFTFIFIGMFQATLSLIFSTLTWYLLLNCAVKYDVLGSRLRKMGMIENKVNKRIPSEREKENLFARELIDGIKTYNEINEYFRSLTSE